MLVSGLTAGTRGARSAACAFKPLPPGPGSPRRGPHLCRCPLCFSEAALRLPSPPVAKNLVSTSTVACKETHLTFSLLGKISNMHRSREKSLTHTHGPIPRRQVSPAPDHSPSVHILPTFLPRPLILTQIRCVLFKDIVSKEKVGTNLYLPPPGLPLRANWRPSRFSVPSPSGFCAGAILSQALSCDPAPRASLHAALQPENDPLVTVDRPELPGRPVA